MRTTIDVEDRILRAAKRYAAEHDTTLAKVIEDALREHLRPRNQEPFRLELLTKRGRLLPGVDLDDRDALYDLMERPDDRG